MILVWKLLFLSITIAAKCSANNPVLLDLEEINLVQYDVKIGDQPIVISDQNEAPPVQDDVMFLPMTNKKGQKYHCLLPKPKDDEDALEKVEDTAENPVELTSLEKAKKLLEPMESQPCLLKTKDWWTYEFCYGKQVRQFHMEEGNRPTEPIMILGLYDHDEELEEETASTVKFKRHHSQIYKNGSQCDLTGSPRQTEVRFECDPTAVIDIITQVDEPQSCVYIITVKTSKICSIPQLRPPPIRKPLKIECQPLLTADEYKKYQIYLQAKEKAEAKLAEDLEVKQKQNLLKALDGEDISHIDVDSEEGMQMIEGMVGLKLAEKLMGEIGSLFGKALTPSTSSKWIVPSEGQNSIEVQEVTLESGEKQTRLVEKSSLNSLLSGMKSDRERRKKAESAKRKEMAKDFLNMFKTIDEIADFQDSKEGKSDKNAEDKRLRVDAIKELESYVDELNSKLDQEGQSTDKKNVNLDPRSDVSDEDEMIEELVNTVKKMSTSTDLKQELQNDMENAVEELLDETASEMNMKLDGLERHQVLEELQGTLNKIMSKIDKAEENMNEGINELQSAIESKERHLEQIKKELKDKENEQDEEELATFTYQDLVDEVDDEVVMANERKYLRALEKKRAELGLKEGDPGYDDVDLDEDEEEKLDLDNYDEDEEEPVEEEEKDFHSSTPEERQLGFEKHLKTIIKRHRKDHYENNPDYMVHSLVEGLAELLKMNTGDTIQDEKRKLALKYKGTKSEPTEEELKKIEDIETNLETSLRKLKKLQKDAYQAMAEDSTQVEEYVKETNWRDSRSKSRFENPEEYKEPRHYEMDEWMSKGYDTIMKEKLEDVEERKEHKKKVQVQKLESQQQKLEEEKEQLKHKMKVLEERKVEFQKEGEASAKKMAQVPTNELADENDDEVDKKVNIKVANLGSTTALKDTASEKRVIKHIERAIKEKLSKAGLETGGRQIEVKFITAGFPTDLLGGNEDEKDDSLSPDETKQFQSMIYNLMVGNQDAYEEIDNQRKTERSYHFDIDELKTEEDATEEN